MPKEGCCCSFVKVVAHFVIVVIERKRELLLLRAREHCISLLKSSGGLPVSMYFIT
jgi:hypothetical protein